MPFRPRILWLLLPAMIIALIVASRRDANVKQLNGECLTSAQCLKAERCIVTPKGDGFATFGRCGELCAEDLQCTPGYRCDEVLVGTEYDAPLGVKAKGLTDAREKRCVQGARKPAP